MHDVRSTKHFCFIIILSFLVITYVEFIFFLCMMFYYYSRVIYDYVFSVLW